jgi:hypothetical protein
MHTEARPHPVERGPVRGRPPAFQSSFSGRRAIATAPPTEARSPQKRRRAGFCHGPPGGSEAWEGSLQNRARDCRRAVSTPARAGRDLMRLFDFAVRSEYHGDRAARQDFSFSSKTAGRGCSPIRRVGASIPPTPSSYDSQRQRLCRRPRRRSFSPPLRPARHYPPGAESLPSHIRHGRRRRAEPAAREAAPTRQVSMRSMGSTRSHRPRRRAESEKAGGAGPCGGAGRTPEAPPREVSRWDSFCCGCWFGL